MTSNKTIKILVSCPSDVDPEKKEINRLCEVFSDTSQGRSNITFKIIDWEGFVGFYGTRPQEQLNEYFGNYDVYIGILWKRFGTPPGSVNASGKENESGTEEEYYIAIDIYKRQGYPKITFFIKDYLRETKSKLETEQLLKVDTFVEQQIQENKSFINKFRSPEQFNTKIVRLLRTLEGDAYSKNKVEEKQKFVSEETTKKIASYHNVINANLPETLIKRSTTHFKFAKETLINPLFETKQDSLDQLMLSNKRVVLLGDAGSGKSTELINLYYSLTQKESPFVPILQKLNSYTPNISLENFLPDFWKDVPSNLLLIIWDGLDEIEPKNFNTVVRQINTFSEKHTEIRILISCRRNFYELPVNDSNSTLQEFEPYLLNDLSLYDVRKYYEKKYHPAQSDKFIGEIYSNNLIDLITKPFFLMLLAEQFNQEQKLLLNRVELFEMFLEKQIELDKNHFKTTVNLRSKRQEIILLLEKIALSMEVLSRNQIEESDILQLISSSEFELLKYCSAFRKKDGEEDLWQFEHNNIQEFLAAKALSMLEFNKLVQLIAYAPNYKKLIPTWVNTLTFLFSILDSKSTLFNELLTWIVDNEKEVIVKFEPDKVSEDLRVQIFQGIFKYYKTHNIIINSNKFNYNQLAKFGQSNENIQFLIEEINCKTNSKTVIINAINLIEYFNIKDDTLKKNVEVSLLKQIDNNYKDVNFTHNTIYALANAKLASEETIQKLMGKFKARNNQYIRASMFALLSKSNVIEDYIDYIIEGLELIDNNHIREDRENTILLDESFYIKECFKGIKSSTALNKLIEYITKSRKYGYGYIKNEAIKDVVSKAIGTYKKDTSIYNPILNWYKNDMLDFRFEKIDLLLQFFNETNTREQAFYELWNNEDNSKKDKQSLVVAKLITPDLLEFIINKYQQNDISKEKLERIFLDIEYIKHENCKELQKIIQDRTDFEIKKPEQINYEALRKERMKVDFDLLFDQDAFIKSTIKVFEKEKKDVLSSDELFEMRKEGNRWLDIDEYYPSVVIRLLRDFVRGNQTISKEKVIKWFKKNTNEEWYRVSLIYNYLSNNKELEVNSEQRKWIEQWCTKNISKVNFKEAIKVHEDGRITFKPMATYIWYFSKRFNIDYQKNVLLDMLSFDSFEGQDRIGIDHITSKLEHKDIVNRMLENIKEGIADSSVLKNHIKYLAKNKVKESYSIILNEIINLERNEYQRKEFLDLFFEYTNDTESIKGILNQADSIIKWDVIDKLRTNDQEDFVEEYLLNIIRETNNDEIGKASEILINLQNIEGLKTYVSWIKKNQGYSSADIMCLNNLTNTKAIPFLIELLEFSYKKEDNIDRINSLNSSVLGAFHNIALVSSESFNLVKTRLGEFIDKNSSLHKNVKYIIYTIERMEEQFYMNEAYSYTINDVKNKLKIIQ